MLSYKEKYLKYKQKYINLKQNGGKFIKIKEAKWDKKNEKWIGKNYEGYLLSGKKIINNSTPIEIENIKGYWNLEDTAYDNEYKGDFIPDGTENKIPFHFIGKWNGNNFTGIEKDNDKFILNNLGEHEIMKPNTLYNFSDFITKNKIGDLPVIINKSLNENIELDSSFKDLFIGENWGIFYIYDWDNFFTLNKIKIIVDVKKELGFKEVKDLSTEIIKKTIRKKLEGDLDYNKEIKSVLQEKLNYCIFEKIYNTITPEKINKIITDQIDFFISYKTLDDLDNYIDRFYHKYNTLKFIKKDNDKIKIYNNYTEINNYNIEKPFMIELIFEDIFYIIINNDDILKYKLFDKIKKIYDNKNK